jgi:small subunit ribosomal protein YMR-31
MNSSGTSETAANDLTPTVFNEFWEAPSRFWKPKGRQLEEDEMNAIMSGGASAY